MRKLVIFCFAVCMTVLTVLSLLNFAQDAEESMILDKRAVILEKPETLSNREFLGQIDTELGKIGADIMYRYAELDGDKPLYRYYKTSHTDSFLSVSTEKGSVRLESDEFFSTAKQSGAMALHLSSLFQDTAIYPLMQAQQHDLTAATWYVAEGQLDAVLHALKGLGYSVTATNERLLSTKLPLYFLFIPAFMLCVSIVFYTLSVGKKNVLKKMEGYTTGNILLGEIKAFAPALCLCFLLIFAAAMICAVWLHPVATWQFGLFLLGDCLWLLVPLILGIMLSLLFLSGQRSAEYVKGKVPKRGIYITNTLAKAAFLIFILFSLTIAMRNITQIYNTFHHPTNYSGVPVISLYASCMGACAASMFFMGTFCFTATNLMRNIGLAIGLLFFFWLLLTSTIIRVLPEILQLFKLSGEVVQDGYLIPFWPSRILYVVCAVALMYWNLHLVNQQPDFNKKRWCKHGNKSM